MDINQRNKTTAPALIDDPVCAVALSPYVTHWQRPVPIGVQANEACVVVQLHAPLDAATADLKRETHTFSDAQSLACDDNVWCFSCIGDIIRLAIQSRNEIALTETDFGIQSGEFARFDTMSDVTLAQATWGFVDRIDQVDMPVLFNSLMARHVYLAPTSYDAAFAMSQSVRSRKHTLAFGFKVTFDRRKKFDVSDLTNTEVAQLFPPNFKWNALGGRGACLSIAESETSHHPVWLVAFWNVTVMLPNSVHACVKVQAA